MESTLKNQCVKSVEKFSQIFDCSICMEIVPYKNFLRLNCCDKHFCRKCWMEWSKKKNQCPCCRTLNPNFTLAPPQSNNFYLEFDFRCKHTGCDKIFSIDKLCLHESNCGFQIIQCKYDSCSFKTIKNEINNHQDSCVYQPWVCPFCQHSTILNLSQSHNESCLEFPISCNYCDKPDIKRRHMTEHQESSCPKFPIKCQYCSEKFIRDVVQQHENSCPNKLVPCTHCSHQHKLKDIENHQKICPQRPWKCPHCNTTEVFIFKSKHLKKCQEKPIKCQYCSKSITRKTKTIHFNSCLDFPISCKHKLCCWKGKRKQHSDHLKSCFCETSHPELIKLLEKQNKTIDQLENRINQLKKSLFKKISDSNNRIKSLSTEISDCDNRIDWLDKKKRNKKKKRNLPVQDYERDERDYERDYWDYD